MPAEVEILARGWTALGRWAAGEDLVDRESDDRGSFGDRIRVRFDIVWLPIGGHADDQRAGTPRRASEGECGLRHLYTVDKHRLKHLLGTGTEVRVVLVRH